MPRAEKVRAGVCRIARSAVVNKNGRGELAPYELCSLTPRSSYVCTYRTLTRFENDLGLYDRFSMHKTLTNDRFVDLVEIDRNAIVLRTHDRGQPTNLCTLRTTTSLSYLRDVGGRAGRDRRSAIFSTCNFTCCTSGAYSTCKGNEP